MTFFLFFMFQVIFSSSQTYELMHCLEEVRLSFRSDDYLARSSRDQETSVHDGTSFSMQTGQSVKVRLLTVWLGSDLVDP